MTDIAALREFLMEQIDHVDCYGGKVWLCAEDARLALSSLDQLEAERQRADHNKVMQLAAEDVSASALRDWSSEGIKLHAANEEIKRLTAELAALKGDQGVVNHVCDNGYELLMDSTGKYHAVHLDGACGMFGDPVKHAVDWAKTRDSEAHHEE